ncbi:MAG: hypothetical protein Alpg2KO_05280 [Alphaproteobacteria bacterium]
MLVDALSNLGILSLAALAVLIGGVEGRRKRNWFPTWLMTGIVFGLVAIAVVKVPITIDTGKFDTRAGPAVLAGFFGGPLAALVTATLGGAARWSVGGDMALGGVTSFFLYAALGVLARRWMQVRQLSKAGPGFYLVLGVLSIIVVLPCFFIGKGASWERGIGIIEKAGPLFVTGNLVGVVLLGLVCEYVRRLYLGAQKTERDLVTSDIARAAGGIGVWTFNTQSGELTWDERMRDVYGMGPDDPLPTRVDEFDKFVLPEDLPGVHERWGKAFENDGIYDDIFRIETSSGEIRHIEVRSRYVDQDGVLTAIGINRDVTDAVTSSRRIARERDKAEEANQAKIRFMANISHELRTPLNAILGYTQLVKMDKTGRIERPQMNDFIEQIHQSGSHLLAMITDLLDLVQIQEDRIKLKMEPTDLQPAIHRAVSGIAPLADKAGINLVVTMPDDLPTVEMDSKAGHQILLNLLSNAVKYSPEQTKVEVAVKATDDGVMVSVKDEGEGIPTEVLDNLGQPLEARSASYEGSGFSAGLGLSITKMLVERMGGTLRFDSSAETGTDASFTLQRAEQSGDDKSSDQNRAA